MELKYPVMITLRQIKDYDPCASGWKKVLAANGGVNADLDAEFELSSIIDSNDLDDCLWALQCRPEYQHLYRKFAVVCADEVKHLMGDGRSLNALDVAWDHSCGEATDAELGAACDAACDAACGAARAAAWSAALGLQANVLRHALTTGEVIRKCQKS